MAEATEKSGLGRVSLQVLVILTVSLTATLAVWRWSEQQGQALEEVRFRQLANEAVDEISNRMSSYDQLLLSGAALLEASDTVTREEWRRFVARIDVGRLFPGTQGLGFAVRVSPRNWAAHERAVRAQGFPDYAIKPAGPRDPAFPIVFIEPFSGRNLRAFGYDMYSDPIRREAMSRARDTGKPALSGKVILVQETGEDVQPGVLLYYPFYSGPLPADVSTRRKVIRGFVYSPLRMGDLSRAVLSARLKRLCVQIFDQQAIAANQLFSSERCIPGRHEAQMQLDMFGRDWIVRVQSTSRLDEDIASRYATLIPGAGVVISVLLVWAVMSMLAERQRRLALGRALAELEVARAEAAGALAAKGRFLAAASHDLRQPLQSLGLYLHLMIDSKAKPGQVEQAARQAYESTARLVDALFDAAALESGSSKLARTRIDLAEVISRVVAESRAEAEGRKLALRERLCHVEVETDEVMLERILRNLISNALKYTLRGGVLITCRRTGNAVRIKVADSGPGIPRDKRQLIFEDFYQIENPERDPRKGLGLGLATVSRLTRLLGYNLRVLSREGVGSIFVVEIPLGSAHPPAPANGSGQGPLLPGVMSA